MLIWFNHLSIFLSSRKVNGVSLMKYLSNEAGRMFSNFTEVVLKKK